VDGIQQLRVEAHNIVRIIVPSGGVRREQFCGLLQGYPDAEVGLIPEYLGSDPCKHIHSCKEVGEPPGHRLARSGDFEPLLCEMAISSGIRLEKFRNRLLRSPSKTLGERNGSRF